VPIVPKLTRFRPPQLATLGVLPVVDKRANLSSILKAYDLEDNFESVKTN